MAPPVRLQLSRKKGFDLQAWSRQVNGLPAVNCARPSKLGNMFRIGGWFRIGDCPDYRGPFRFVYMECSSGKLGHRAGFTKIETALQAVEWYRKFREQNPLREEEISKLRGANLACWCDLCTRHAKTGKPFDEECHDCAPCHCDVLGPLANRPICEDVG